MAPGDRGADPLLPNEQPGTPSWVAELRARRPPKRRQERLSEEIGLLWGPEGPSQTTLVLAAVRAPVVLEGTASAWGTDPGWQMASVRYVSFPPSFCHGEGEWLLRGELGRELRSWPPPPPPHYLQREQTNTLSKIGLGLWVN